MRLPFKESLILILIMIVTTFIIRLTPFIIFRNDEKIPKFIKYLGKVLPFSIIAMLVAYCFVSVDDHSISTIIADIVAGLFVIGMHKKFHNMILSIAGGTIIYMILIRII